MSSQKQSQSTLPAVSDKRGLKVVLTVAALTVFAAAVLWFGLPVSAPVSTPAQVTVPPAAKTPAVSTTDAGPAPVPAAPAQAGVAVPDSASKPAEAVAAGGNVSAQPLAAFDIVRVQPSGEMLVAGRAAPDAVVELLRNGVRHARVVADSSGLFVITEPDLPPGAVDLSLRLTFPDGRQEVSRQSVTVVVAADGREPPLVALAAPGVPTVTLSQPRAAPLLPAPVQVPPPDLPPVSALVLSPAAPDVVATPVDATPVVVAAPDVAATPVAPAARPGIAILSVEAGEAGRMFVSARAAAQASIRLYLNEAYLATALADRAGMAAFTVEKGLTPGSYRVRLDDVDPVAGAVRSRAEAPFEVPASVAITSAPAAAPDTVPVPTATQPAGTSPASSALASTAPALARQAQVAPTTVAPLPVVVPEVRTTTVVRGDNLWRISRNLYGEGLRYTVIFSANQDQIRDPDLIYPGQVFVTPNP